MLLRRLTWSVVTRRPLLLHRHVLLRRGAGEVRRHADQALLERAHLVARRTVCRRLPVCDHARRLQKVHVGLDVGHDYGSCEPAVHQGRGQEERRDSGRGSVPTPVNTINMERPHMHQSARKNGPISEIDISEIDRSRYNGLVETMIPLMLKFVVRHYSASKLCDAESVL